MSLTPLGNNQTNLQWRNAINSAFTVLETVSGITYSLSGENNDSLLLELSAKAGKGTPLSALTTLVNELSAKAGKGTPLSGSVATNTGRIASLTISATTDDTVMNQKALSANTALASGVDVNLQNGNEFVISGSTNTPNYFESDGNLRVGAYETSAVSVKVLSGLVQAAPGLRFANFSNNVGQSNYIGGMNLNTAFNYSSKIGIIDIAGVRGTANTAGVSGSYSVGIGSQNSVRGSQVVAIGVTNDQSGDGTAGVMVGTSNQLRTATEGSLLGHKNIAEGATTVTHTTLVGVENSGYMAFGESNRIQTGNASKGLAVGNTNTGSTANFGTQGAYAIGSNNVIGTSVASNLTFGNQNNNTGTNSQGLILGYKNRLVDGEGVISIGHSNNSIMGAGSGVIIGHGNTTSGNSDAVLIGSQNYEISGTAALGTSNTGGLNVIIGKGNKGQQVAVSVGYLNSVSGLRGIGIGSQNISESDSNNRGSIALGYLNSAKGESIAIGFQNSGAGNSGSIIMGQQNTETNAGNTGFPGIVLGYANKAKTTANRTAGTAIAIGTSNNSINGQGGTIILGRANTLSGKFSTAIGKSNKDVGSGQTSQVYIGNSNKSYLSGSVIIGDSNTLSGQESVIIGHRNSVSGTADAKAGITIGSDNTVSGSLHSVTIGKKNIVPNGSTSINIGVQNENRDGAAVTHRTNIGFRNITTNAGSSNGSVALGFQNSGSHALLLGASNRDTATTHLGTALTPLVGNENAVGALFGTVGAFGYGNTNTLGSNDYIVGNLNKIQHADTGNMIFGASNIAADGAYNNVFGSSNHIKAGQNTYANVMIGRSNNTSGGTGMTKIGYSNTDNYGTPSHPLSSNGQTHVIGNNNKTDALNIAIGNSNTISGQYGIVIGTSLSARPGRNIVTMGQSNNIFSSFINAIGSSLSGGSTLTDAYYSNMMGIAQKVNGQFNTAIGTTIKTRMIGQVAIGYNVSAEGASQGYGIVMGALSNVSRDYGVAIGYAVSAGNHTDTVIGYGNKSKGGSTNSRNGGNVVYGISNTALKDAKGGFAKNVIYGQSTVTSGKEHLHIGRDNAGASNTLAKLGHGPIVSGQACISIGHNVVSGDSHVVLGDGNVVNGASRYSLMLGIGNEVSGAAGYSTAIGAGVHVRSPYGMALGHLSRAGKHTESDGGQLAIGYSASAFGNNSIAIGKSSRGTANQSVAIGPFAANVTSGASEFGQFVESGGKPFRKTGIRLHKPINDSTGSTNQATSSVNQMGGVFFTVPILSASPLAGLSPSLTGECALGKIPNEMAGFRRKGRNMILDVNIGGTLYGIDLGTAKVNVATKTYGTSATGSSDGA